MNKILQCLGWVGLLGGLTALGASGCTTEAYCFVCEDDGFGDAGEASTSRPQNAATTSNIITTSTTAGGGNGGEGGDNMGGQAGQNNNCDDIDLDTDVLNCGVCGVACRINGAFPKCVDGVCVIDMCAPGRQDLNDDPRDGCESICNISNDGVEICDGIDNDCDGIVDNGFDLTTVENCGSCGNECELAHAIPTCERVGGNYTCRIQSCEEDFFNFDGQHGNGCEKQCIQSNGGQEICDGRDNDCDGQVDEETPNAGMPCESPSLCPWHPEGKCVGPCADRGVYVCSGNQLVCVPKAGAPTPSIEVCDPDGVDEDCDGLSNEDFNLMTDPNNCGACGNVCDVPNAFSACVNGECVVGACRNGYNDLDPNSPGCEYECPEAINDEICDGVDNDCDGEVDEPADLEEPTTPCLQTGPCSGSDWVCGENPNSGETEWYCNYQAQDPLIEVDPTTVWPGPELACDGFDNNCDGYVDEGMGLYQFCTNNSQCVGNCNQGRCTCSNDSQCDFGYGCSGGRCVAQCFDGIGECQDTAFMQCAADGDGVICPAQAITSNASNELCDGKDNNCDGQIDETTPAAGNPFSGVVDEVVRIAWGGQPDFYIYKYEASRPDALSSDGGVSDARSCSKPGVIPWTSVSQAEAAAACAAAGMQLCTQTQWERACERDTNSSVANWSFATTPTSYRTGVCNDVEHSRNATTPSVWATGSGANCYADAPNGDIFDLSGNVSEWTSTTVQSGGKTYYRVRGGNYTSYGPATACDFSFVLDVPTFANADLGFRCCGANPPNVP